MRKSEERLRTLHPFAMARYDRLRAEGAEPLDAMRESAPLFDYRPDARPAGHRPVPGIEAPCRCHAGARGHRRYPPRA